MLTMLYGRTISQVDDPSRFTVAPLPGVNRLEPPSRVKATLASVNEPGTIDRVNSTVICEGRTWVDPVGTPVSALHGDQPAARTQVDVAAPVPGLPQTSVTADALTVSAKVPSVPVSPARFAIRNCVLLPSRGVIVAALTSSGVPSRVSVRLDGVNVPGMTGSLRVTSSWPTADLVGFGLT